MDLGALSRTLHSSSASSEEKLHAAQALANLLLASSNTTNSPNLPGLLRSHYISALLDWLLNAVGRAAGTSGKQRKNKKKAAQPIEDTSFNAPNAPQGELWELLVAVLNSFAISDDRPLPASLLPNITSALTHLSGLQSPSTLVSTLAKLLDLLSTKFSASFKPSLEPTVALVEAALTARQTHDIGAAGAALKLLLPLVKLHPNPRKAWDAVVPRLTGLLVNVAFAAHASETTISEGWRDLAQASRDVLSAAAFSQAHVSGLAEAAAIVAASASANSTQKMYASQFFEQIEILVQQTRDFTEASVRNAALHAIPWFIDQYCAAYSRHRAAAQIAAAIAKEAGLGNFGDASKDKDADEGAPSGIKVIGGVPIDADFKFFAAVSSILQKDLESLLVGLNVTSNTAKQSNNDQYMTWSGVEKLLKCLAGVCCTLKQRHIYRPTEDPLGHHRAFLAEIVSKTVQIGALDSGNSAGLSGTALEVVQAVLAVEHRGVQAHLPTLWSMLWSQSTAGTAYSRDVRMNVAASLVQAYAELRQLEVLLSSLADAVHALNSLENASAAAALLSSAAFLDSFGAAIRDVPSGQVAALVRMIARWIQMISTDTATALVPLVVSDLGAACISSLTVDVITAPAVADAAQGLVEALAPSLLAALPAPSTATAGLLAVYCQTLRLHSVCCLLHPEVKPLVGQQLQGFAGGDFFDALDAKAPSSSHLWKLAACSQPAVKVAALIAAKQRLQTLYYRKLHQEYACNEEAQEAENSEASEEMQRMAVMLLDSAVPGDDRIFASKEKQKLPKNLVALSVVSSEDVPGVAQNLILHESGPILEALLASVPSAKLGDLVGLLLEAGSSANKDFRLIWGDPSLAAALPREVAKRTHSLISELLGVVEGRGAIVEPKKKKAKKSKDEGASSSFADLALLKCLIKAGKGDFSAEKLQQALTQASQLLGQMEPLLSASPATAAASAKKQPAHGKRKYEPGESNIRSDKVVELLHALHALLSRVSEILQLSPCSVFTENGSDILTVSGLTTATIALFTSFKPDLSHQTGDLAFELASKAVQLITESTSMETASAVVSLDCPTLPEFLSAMARVAEADMSLVRSISGIMKHAVLCTLCGNTGSDVLRWVEQILRSVSIITPTDAVLLEGAFAGLKHAILSQQPSSSSLEASQLSLASSMISYFESTVLSLENSSLTTVAAFSACAGHIITLRCLADSSLVDSLSLPSPLLTRLPLDLTSVASALITFLEKVTNDTIIDAKVADFLCYLQAVSLATSCMKPAATTEHFANLLCFVLHVLALLPIDEAALDPVRRNLPLTAAFPAARVLTKSNAREAALETLATLVNGCTSAQLRHILSFVEHCINSSECPGVMSVYGLPIAELALMVLEGTRGKEALRMLSQRSERLATALTTSISQVTNPVFKTRDNLPLWSFRDLYAEFIAAVGDAEATAAAFAAIDLPGDGLHFRAYRGYGKLKTTLAVATSLRSLESIAARPKVLPLSGRHIARLLNCIDGICSPGGLLAECTNSSAALFTNLCHVLTAFTRHREQEIGRCLPLCSHAVRALLLALVRWEAHASKQEMSCADVRVYCAEALASVMAELASLKASEKYCPHVLADYVILAACPVTPLALSMLSLPPKASTQDTQTLVGADNQLLCTPEVYKALRQGAYAVYGACGSAGVQYVYAMLSARGSGGLWRQALAALKADHDKNFKYTGKV